ncbi:hypothetical protein OF83DRAFT_1042284, partial [Amylostereum chailletii]
GLPVIVSGMEDALQHVWTPQSFIKEYGTKLVTLVDTKTDQISATKFSVAYFFEQFGKYEEIGRTRWKLKDWPPKIDFIDEFRSRYEVLMNALPPGLRDWLRRDGRLNIIAFFAVNAVGPDIGPKMYNALCTMFNALCTEKDEDDQHPTTYLHEDMCCAFNIMLYSESRPDGQLGAARWDIIHPDDTDLFRRISLEEKICDGVLDPIHSQETYLSPGAVDKLRSRGVRVCTIFQEVGELVMIPAKSPHQVTNLSDANKIACDFLNPLRLTDTETVAHELRNHRLSLSRGEDVLQLYHSLWWAWI